MSATFCVILNGHVDAQIKHFEYFDISKGLISNDLTDVQQGEDGYIYIASAGSGISRFDGVNFEHFTNKQELGGLYFFEIITAGDAMWFGGEDHLLEYSNGLWHNYEVEGAGEVHQILVYDDDFLFCVGSNFAFLFSRNSRRSERVEIGDVVINRGILFQEALFLATDQGIWKKSGGAVMLLPSDGLMVERTTFMLKLTDKLMFFDESMGLIEWSSGQMKLIVPKSEFPSQNITFMLEGGLGQIYFGTRDQGIIIYQPQEELWLGIGKTQLQNAKVTSMHFDRWDNAWVGTMGGGLIRFSSQGFNTIPFEHLSGRYIEQFWKAEGVIYIQYRNELWDRIGSGTATSYDIELGKWGPAHCWINLDSTTVLFASDNGLLVAHDTVLTFLSQVDVGHVNAFYMEDSANVLVAGDAGIVRLKFAGKDSSNMSIYDSLMFEETASMQKIIGDVDGQIWCNSDRKIGVLGGASVSFSDTVVTAVEPYEDGLIMGTRDQGLFFVNYESEMISLIPVPGEHVAEGEIRSLASDINGKLWIGLKNSIIQVSLARGRPLEALRYYDSRNGLPRLEVFANAMEIDAQGHVWVGTTSGLLELLPERVLTTTTGPILNFVGITIDSNSYFSFGPQTHEALISIDPGSNLSISMNGIDQRVPKDLRYFYKCSPVVSEWTQSTTDGIFSFFSLNPGSYDFEVMVQNSEGLRSNSIHIPFKIQQPYYLRWWFLAIIGVSAVLLSFMLYRWRLKTTLRETNQRALELQTQNKILHLEHAASRLQMNPHFIFNALQSIQQKVAVGDRLQARMGLQTFSKLMRGYLEHTRKERILLEDELELLKQYLTVEKELKDHTFEYEISVPDEMDTSFVEIPAMMIQPFVENAIKHGLPRDDRMGSIKIAFSWQGKLLRCQIDDIGPGIDEVIPQKNHNSAGMRITRERLEAYFPHKKFNPLTVGIYKDETGKICGTRVILLLPTAF